MCDTLGKKIVTALVISVVVYALSAPFRSFIDKLFERKKA